MKDGLKKYYINYNEEIISEGNENIENVHKEMTQLEDYEEFGYLMNIVQLSEEELALINLCVQVFDEQSYNILQKDSEMANVVIRDFNCIHLTGFIGEAFIGFAKEKILSHEYREGTFKSFCEQLFDFLEENKDNI